MQIIKSPRQLQQKIQQLRKKGKRIGFVPTMGALHQGHLSLIQRARRESDICVLSIFVNPAQFGPKEDFKKYPRKINNDKKLAQRKKVDIIFYPTAKSMYPDGFLTTVDTGRLGVVLCGKSRPGHFNGVATIVAKLLNLVDPDVMYLGQKDAQQAVILKRIVADFNFKTTIKICPTVRETDGLALSSRNKYLSTRQREEAVILYRSLKQAEKKIKQGERSVSRVKDIIRSLVRAQCHGKIEYIACVDPLDLTPLTTVKNSVLLALAVRFGKARLIDNIIVRIL